MNNLCEICNERENECHLDFWIKDSKHPKFKSHFGSINICGTCLCDADGLKKIQEFKQKRLEEYEQEVKYRDQQKNSYHR